MSIRVLIAQINPTVGNIHENAETILTIIHEHSAQHDLIVFPELALSGYPPEDLLYQDAFHQQVEYQLDKIKQASSDCHVVVGHPERRNASLFNAASVFYQQKKIAHYHKQQLPNQGVFDEKRYFTPGRKQPCVITIKSHRFGLCICEDLWQPGPVQQLEHAEVHCLLAINASPFETGKQERRIHLLKTIAQNNMSVLYVNLVGGQDELVFDGQSLFVDATGELCVQGPSFETALISFCITRDHNSKPENTRITPPLEAEALLYKALVTATRDYLTKNHVSGAIVGVSGGIDSALVLAIAADAIGAQNVTAVKMPSRHTQPMSIEDADFEIQALGVEHHTLSIEPAYQAFLNTLASHLSQHAPDSTEENIQARIRAVLLMALSNRTGRLVLTTSNKSELAMGYGTLFGDMAGGFSVLKDLYKTQVYALARYRNRQSVCIPQRVFTRPPTAELAPNQTDQDTLPPYETLDALIEAYVEQNQTMKQLRQQGFSATDIQFVIQRMKQQEYKRKLAPPGPKLTTRAFGRDWRFPNTQGQYFK